MPGIEFDSGTLPGTARSIEDQHWERNNANNFMAAGRPFGADHRSVAIARYLRRDQIALYFFLAPVRAMLLIASGARPDFSAISRSCSMM